VQVRWDLEATRLRAGGEHGPQGVGGGVRGRRGTGRVDAVRGASAVLQPPHVRGAAQGGGRGDRVPAPRRHHHPLSRRAVRAPRRHCGHRREEGLRQVVAASLLDQYVGGASCPWPHVPLLPSFGSCIAAAYIGLGGAQSADVAAPSPSLTLLLPYSFFYNVIYVLANILEFSSTLYGCLPS
jgi:hypothetical protein